MKRTFAIGDIHGCYLGIKQLIDRLNLKEGDTLIFLGDYVDGWSQNIQVVLYLIELSKKYNCIFLRGNHDDWTLGWLEDGDEYKWFNEWMQNGGESTLKSFNEYFRDHPNIDFAKAKILKFFQDTKLYFIDEENRAYVHAGFQDDGGVQNDDDFTLIWDRWLAKETFRTHRIPSNIAAHKEIFIGHTPTPYLAEYIAEVDDYEPLNKYNVWAIDTAAGFSGKITAINVETKEYIQSDFVRTLYPNEKGRNKD